MIILVVLTALLSPISHSIISTASPLYQSDTNFRAGRNTLINSVVTANYDQTFQLYFANSTVSIPPCIAIGYQSYEGVDFLLQQFFEILLGDIDQNGFRVQVILVPSTQVSLLSISYIAVEGSYPYVNALPCVYLNSLQNITVMSSEMTSFTSIIDYSNSEYYFTATNAAPSIFSAPFSNVKIVFFLTALWITSTTGVSINIDVSYSILSQNSYSMTVSVAQNMTITKLAFSKVIYDISNFTITSRKYLHSYDWIISDGASSTNYFNVPSITVDNQLIVGLKSLSNINTGQCSLIYSWSPGIYGGNYGIELASSTPNGLTNYIVSVLYFLYWDCPLGYPYYNLVNSLCQNECGGNTFADDNTMSCGPCTNIVCDLCQMNDTNTCTSCYNNFVLLSSNCICDTTAGTKVFVNNNVCFTCSDLEPHCTSCSYTGNTTLPYDSSLFTCLDCNNAAGYFIDTNNQCSTCSVAHCTTCTGYSTCGVCQSGYGITTSGSCSLCPLTGCSVCTSLTVCQTCMTGYTLSGSTCSSCPSTCNCGGYQLPYLSNGDCSTVCGDGIIIFPYQQCDDGNLIKGDGCSNTCLIEENTSCINKPSVCYLNININAKLVNIESSLSNCNMISFTFQVIPNLLFFQIKPVDWSKLIVPQTNLLTLIPNSIVFSNGYISLNYTYNQTLQHMPITFTFYPSAIITNPPYLSQTKPFSVSTTVKPTNGLVAIYCSNSMISVTSSVETFETAQSAIAYVGLFLSIFSLKIVGLQMFGVLQLSYIVLSDYDYLNPVLKGMLNRRQVNGYNVNSGSNGSPEISDRVIYNGYSSEVFLQNYNVMFYLTAAMAVIGLIMYTITYFLNKDTQSGSKLHDNLKSQSITSQRGDQPKQQEPKSVFYHRISKYILKEVLMTFVIFNMFNMSFSAGLQIRYINEVETGSIICMLISFTLCIALIIAQLVTDKLQFGEFTQKFKKQHSQTNYMIVTAIYRFTLGLLLALLNDWVESGVVFTFVSGAFLTYLFLCEPFIDNFQNIRSKAIHSIHVIILFINMYYRFESAQDEVEVSYIVFPAYIQLAVVGFAVIGSTILLSIELVLKIKTYISSNKNVPHEGDNIFNVSHNKENMITNQNVETMEVEQIQAD